MKFPQLTSKPPNLVSVEGSLVVTPEGTFFKEDVQGISAQCLRLMAMTDMWPSPQGVLWKLPLLLSSPTLLAVTIQMVWEGTELEKPPHSPVNHATVIPLAHMSPVWWAAWSDRRLSNGGWGTPGWPHICKNKGEVAVASERGSLHTVQTPTTWAFPLGGLCLLLPCPLWFGLPISTPSPPVYPSWSLTGVILSPLITHTTTLCIPAILTLLYWIKTPKHKMCTKGYIVCEYFVL